MVEIEIKTKEKIEEMSGKKYIICPICGYKYLSIVEVVERKKYLFLDNFGYIEEKELSSDSEQISEKLMCEKCKTEFNIDSLYEFIFCYKDGIFYITKTMNDLLTEETIDTLMLIEENEVNKSFKGLFIGLYDIMGKSLKCGDKVKIPNENHYTEIVYKNGCFCILVDKTFIPLIELSEDNKRVNVIKV